MSAPDLEIITYGGGDLLLMVFNAIAMLFYGGTHNEGFVRPLCVISAMIGGGWGISRCFFQAYTEGFIKTYFLPLLVIPALFILPQARVHIIDKFHDKPLVVDHVPLLFAKIISFSSYWGNEMTKAIEKVMHTPNDIKYSKTGMLFGADSALDFSRLKLNNATLAQNLHHFTQQCIVYDIALGRYTIDQLRKESDLLTFLKKNTSKVRMIPYVNPDEKKMDFLTCIESLDQMTPLFQKETQYYTKHEVLKNLPIAYQTLLSFKKQSEDHISDQIIHSAYGNPETISKDILVVNAFDTAMARFAVERARDNQRSVYQTAGSLAGSSLVSMRIIFEALIYACCVFILPLSLIPGGIKFIGSWIFLNIWIQLWPPLYGVLNYITMICAQKYASSVMGGLSNGFSLFTSAGFQEMALDTAALGGYLSLSVPVISFYLLQNLNSLVHLTGSLLAPTQSAISTAGTELSSGNYSYSNTSVGQMSYGNQTAFQHNTAPSMSSGFFTDNYGTHQIKYGQDQLTVNQDLSNLNTSISTAEAYTNTLQNALHNAETKVDSTQGLYTETRGIAERSAADLVQHLASSEAFSSSYNTSETEAMQESANFVKNATESWGNQHGLSARESLEYFASMGLEWPIVISARTGHSGSCGVVSEEGQQEAQNLLQSKDFQEHFQRVFNCSKNDSINSMTDEGKRFVENYATSMENLKSTQEQFSTAFSELNQISENLSYVQSHASTVNTNLNTDFSNWLSDQGKLGLLFDKNSGDELNELRDLFIEEKCKSNLEGLTRYEEPTLSPFDLPSIEKEGNISKEKMHQKAQEMDLFPNQSQDRGHTVLNQYEAQKGTVSQKFSSHQTELNQTQNKFKDNLQEQSKKTGTDRLTTRMKDNVYSSFDKIQKQDASVWSWFDDYANPTQEEK